MGWRSICGGGVFLMAKRLAPRLLPCSGILSDWAIYCYVSALGRFMRMAPSSHVLPYSGFRSYPGSPRSWKGSSVPAYRLVHNRRPNFRMLAKGMHYEESLYHRGLLILTLPVFLGLASQTANGPGLTRLW
jgi:hypothetical protein